jgi:alkyl sulfatase BDS1-like metallo-beta-lactamase superfamily hydrolase
MNKILLEKFFKSFELKTRANSIKLMGLDGRILFDFSPSGDGCWLAEFVNGLLNPIHEVKDEEYDAKLTTRLEDMIRAQKECIRVPDGISQGWLKVEGNTSLVSKLCQACVS